MILCSLKRGSAVRLIERPERALERALYKAWRMTSPSELASSLGYLGNLRPARINWEDSCAGVFGKLREFGFEGF